MNCTRHRDAGASFRRGRVNCDGIRCGSRVRAAGLISPSEVTGIGRRAEGQDGSLGMAAPISQAIRRNSLTSAEETGGFRLGCPRTTAFRTPPAARAGAWSGSAASRPRPGRTCRRSVSRAAPACPCRTGGNAGPDWVPAGTFTRALPPSIVGTSNSPPSAAVTIEIGTRQCRSAPSRWKNSCGADRQENIEVARPGRRASRPRPRRRAGCGCRPRRRAGC